MLCTSRSRSWPDRRRPSFLAPLIGLVALVGVACSATADPDRADDRPAVGGGFGATPGGDDERAAGPAADAVVESADGLGADLQTATASSVTADESDLEGPVLESLLAQRYHEFWAAFDEARVAPSGDPAVDFPLLAQHAAGELLEVSYEHIIELAESGQALQSQPAAAIGDLASVASHRVRVDSVDGVVARLTSCVVSDDLRVVVATGEIVADQVQTILASSTLALTEGRWKLIRSRAIVIEDGVGGCWLSGDYEHPPDGVTGPTPRRPR